MRPAVVKSGEKDLLFTSKYSGSTLASCRLDGVVRAGWGRPRVVYLYTKPWPSAACATIYLFLGSEKWNPTVGVFPWANPSMLIMVAGS